MSKPIRYTLSHPFTLKSGRRVTDITLTLSMTVRDLEQLASMTATMDRDIRILSILSREDKAVIYAMEVRDYWRLVALSRPYIQSLPENWRALCADLAGFFHWSPSELKRMTVEQMMAHHQDLLDFLTRTRPPHR